MTKPRIYQRTEWGAKHRDGFGLRHLPATQDFLHHSVTPAPSAKASWRTDVAAVRTLENIGDAQFGGGISYNYVICPSGRIFEGVTVNRIGAHTKGRNTTGLGCVMVGNYQTKQPTTAALASLLNLRLYCIEQGWLANVAMKGHRQVKSTACPGDALYALIDDINLFKKPVKFGMRGAVVKKIQQRLITHGAVKFKTASGVFGPKTKAGVIAFQKSEFGSDNGGIVGARTYAALIRKP